MRLNSHLSDEARTRINMRAVLVSTKPGPCTRRSRWHYTHAPVMQILNDFAIQAGGDLGVSDPSLANFVKDRTADVDLDNTGFWQAPSRDQRCQQIKALDRTKRPAPTPRRGSGVYADRFRQPIFAIRRWNSYCSGSVSGKSNDQLRQQSEIRHVHSSHRRRSRAKAARPWRIWRGLDERMRR